jgi:hypothetical protein
LDDVVRQLPLLIERVRSFKTVTRVRLDGAENDIDGIGPWLTQFILSKSQKPPGYGSYVRLQEVKGDEVWITVRPGWDQLPLFIEQLRSYPGVTGVWVNRKLVPTQGES